MAPSDEAPEKPEPRRGRGVLLLVAGLVVGVVSTLALAGGSDDSGPDWRPQPIAVVEEAPGTNLYSVGFHCHESGRVTVSESADRIILTLEVLGDPLGVCTTSEPIFLDEPRGDREVFDGTTGLPVPDDLN